MRSFVLSALAAATVLTVSAAGLSTHANAAARRHHHHVQVAPYVRDYPYGSFNMFVPRGYVAPAPMSPAGPNFGGPKEGPA